MSKPILIAVQHVHAPLPGTRQQTSGDEESATCACGTYIVQREHGWFLTAWHVPKWVLDNQALIAASHP